MTMDVASAINPVVPAMGNGASFCCLYFLTIQRIAHTTNYEPLLGFLGVDVKAMIRNATYTSDKTIQEMVFIMSEVIEVERIKESGHFSLMFDESTDCTVSEQLAIHGRFIHKSAGEPILKYLTYCNQR